jgi:hypothetical protein
MLTEMKTVIGIQLRLEVMSKAGALMAFMICPEMSPSGFPIGMGPPITETDFSPVQPGRIRGTYGSTEVDPGMIDPPIAGHLAVLPSFLTVVMPRWDSVVQWMQRNLKGQIFQSLKKEKDENHI